MKKILTLLILLVSFTINAQTWQWAKTLNINTDPTGMCHDNNGNLYIVTTVSVGSAPIIIGSYTLSTPGNQSCIIRYDANGNINWLWATDQLRIYKLATDGANNLYMAGFFSGTVSINNNTITSVPNSGSAFAGKFNASGTVVWLKSGGGSNISYGLAVTSDLNGNCYVAGRYGGNSATFGTLTVNAVPSTNNYFLIKYDGSGNEQWLSGTQTGYFLNNDLATDLNGNVFVSGQVSSTVNIGTYSLTSTGASYCLMKYNSNGQIQWHRTGVGPASSGSCVRTHTNGNVYVSGYFNSSTMVVGTTTMSNNGSFDFFISGYDTNGNVLWARSGGGAGQDQAFTHALYSGGIYVALQFSSTAMTIGTLTINQPTTANTLIGDVMVLARYDYSGNLLNAKVYEGGGDDYLGISIYNDCNLYLGGDLYSATATFSPFVLSNPTYSPTFGGEVIMVGKMNTEGVSGPTLSVSGNTSVCLGDVITFSLAGASSYTASFTGSGTQTVLSGNTFSFNPVSNSTFVVTGSTPSLSCQATTVAPILINPAPSLSVAASRYTVCVGNSATLTVTGASTYTWGGGQTSNTLLVNPVSTSTFIVTGSSTLGCMASKISTIVVSPCTEVTNNNAELVSEMFPNPSSKEVTIKMRVSDIYQVTLTDITGRYQYKSEKYEQTDLIKLDVSHLRQGIYFVIIKNKESEQVYKVIVD